LPAPTAGCGRSGLRPVGAARGAELDSGPATLLDAFTAPAPHEAGRRASALPARVQLLRLDLEPWRPADMLAGGKLLSFGLLAPIVSGSAAADLVRELGEERDGEDRPALSEGQTHRDRSRGREASTCATGLRLGGARSGACATRSAWPTGGEAGFESTGRVRSGAAQGDGRVPCSTGDPHLPSGIARHLVDGARLSSWRAGEPAAAPRFRVLPGISLGRTTDVAFAASRKRGLAGRRRTLSVERSEDESYGVPQGSKRSLVEITSSELIACSAARTGPSATEVRTHAPRPASSNRRLGGQDDEADARPALGGRSTSPPSRGAHVGRSWSRAAGPELVELCGR
jgi:hypothetical protein